MSICLAKEPKLSGNHTKNCSGSSIDTVATHHSHVGGAFPREKTNLRLPLFWVGSHSAIYKIDMILIYSMTWFYALWKLFPPRWLIRRAGSILKYRYFRTWRFLLQIDPRVKISIPSVFFSQSFLMYFFLRKLNVYLMLKGWKKWTVVENNYRG